MGIAQKLYEGIEIEGGDTTGLITYMRTDSTRIANEAIEEVRGLINKKFGSRVDRHTRLYSGRRVEINNAFSIQ